MSGETILVIDDDIYIQEILKSVLISDYRVEVSGDGNQALELIAEFQPDLILLDIEMPGMSGFDVCRQIKGSFDIEKLPSIVFVSSHTSAEHRLEAYAAGADNFLTKPVDPTDLKLQVKAVLAARSEIESLKLSAREAMNVAMSAMSDTAALGNVVHMYRRIFTGETPEALAKLLLEMMAAFDLSGTVQVRCTTVCTLNTGGAPCAMDGMLLSQLAHDDDAHIVSYGTRTAFNYPGASMLVKNMPINNPEAYGKLKDWVAIGVEGVGERAGTLHALSMSAVVNRTRTLLHEVTHALHNQQIESSQALQKMGGDLEESLLFLGLTEGQEEALMNIVAKAKSAVEETHKNGEVIEHHMQELLADLSAVVTEAPV